MPWTLTIVLLALSHFAVAAALDWGNVANAGGAIGVALWLVILFLPWAVYRDVRDWLATRRARRLTAGR